MKTWEFTDKESGEDFFVEATDETSAYEIARKYFDKPKCYGEVSEEYAEMMGYDTYQERGINMIKYEIPTNKMITDIDAKYGKDNKETLLMRLYVLSFKTNKGRTYNDCLELYKKLMK